MSTQDQGRARPQDRDDDAQAEDTIDAAVVEKSAELDAEVDAILDEIDEVLEVNAEDFVKSFVQKGGQ